MLATLIPQEGIRCERCNKIFFRYAEICNLFDADSESDSSPLINGNINRIVCRYCKTEFTFETPVVVYSYIHKYFIFADCNIYHVPARKFSLSTSISGAKDWKFRVVAFAADASEKVRIFRDGLNDAAIELIKLKHIKEYRTLILEDEYITYEEITEKGIHFTKRDDCDKVLKNYYLPFSLYLKELNYNSITGDWTRIDRNWALKQTEE